MTSVITSREAAIAIAPASEASSRKWYSPASRPDSTGSGAAVGRGSGSIVTTAAPTSEIACSAQVIGSTTNEQASRPPPASMQNVPRSCPVCADEQRRRPGRSRRASASAARPGAGRHPEVGEQDRRARRAPPRASGPSATQSTDWTSEVIRLPRSRERSVPGERLADHQAVHLGGALVREHGLEVVRVPQHAVLERDAVRAEDRPALARDLAAPPGRC